MDSALESMKKIDVALSENGGVQSTPPHLSSEMSTGPFAEHVAPPLERGQARRRQDDAGRTAYCGILRYAQDDRGTRGVRGAG